MSTQTEPFPLLTEIMAFEEGEADEERVIVLFQHLVDTGMAWTLQGFYGRTARDLIEAGYVLPPHVTYPHEPGYLVDCPRCEAGCHCTPGHAECVFEGEHNSTAES